MNEKARQYYEYLKGKNVSLPDNFESFQATMQDDKKRDSYYNYLKSQEGVNVAPNFESFTATLKKKEVSGQDSVEPVQQPSEQPTTPLNESTGVTPLTNEETAKIDTPTQGIEQILPQEVKDEVKEANENPNYYVEQKISQKQYTPTEDIRKMISDLETINSELEKRPASSSNLGVRSERKELLQNRDDINKAIDLAMMNNKDIESFNDGAVYETDDGERLTNSEARKYITSNKALDRMDDGGDAGLSINGDDDMSLLLKNQKMAQELGYWTKLGRSTASTGKMVLDGLKIKSAELLSLVSDDPEFISNALDVISSGSGGVLVRRDSEANAAVKEAEKRAKEEGISKSDAFLLEYAKGLKKTQNDIRGIQYERSEDLIDRAMDGDVTGFVGEAATLAVESSPFLGAAMMPVIGLPLIGASVQSDKYYEFRESGLSKEEAAKLSAGSALIEVADGIITKGLFNKSLGISGNAIKRLAGKEAMSKAEMTVLRRELGKAVLNNFTVEPSTEFLQGTFGSAIDQYALEGDINWSKAGRDGLIEASAGLATGAAMSSIPAMSYIYAEGKNRGKINTLEKAVFDELSSMSEDPTPESIKTKKETAKLIAKEIIDEGANLREKFLAATPVQKKELKDLSVEESRIQKQLDDNDITPDAADVLNGRLEDVQSKKSKILSEIDKVINDNKETKTETDGIQDEQTELQEVGKEETKKEVTKIGDRLESKYNGLTIDLYEDNKTNTLSLGKIVVDEDIRGEGVGSDVMSEVIDYADKNGLKVILTPSEDFGGDKTRLKSFYKKFGFIENKGKNRDFSHREDMYRNPKNEELSKEKKTSQDQSGAETNQEQQANVSPVPAEEQGATDQIESLRRNEQEELLEAIPEAENAITDGKVDRSKIESEEGKAKFDEIYDKYDELISPLLETEKSKSNQDILSRKDKKGKGAVAAVKDIVKKVKSRNVGENTNPKKIAEAVIPYLEGSKFISELDTNDRESVFRGILSQFGIDTKKSPSVNKAYEIVFGKKFVADKKKGFTTKQLLKMAEQQDKRGIREGKKQESVSVQDFGSKIKFALKDVPKGVLNSTQASQLAKAATGVRTKSQMRRFEDVSTRIIDDAEYAKNLSEAQSLQSKIRSRSKQSAYPSNLTSAMADFAKIEPSKVPDLGQYKLYGEELLNTTKKISIKNGQVVEPQSVSIGEVYSEYIDRYNSLSEEDAKRDLLEDYNDLFESGVLDKEMSVDELNEVISSIYSDAEVSEEIGKRDNTSLEKLIDFKVSEALSIPKENLSPKAKEQLEILEENTIEGSGLDTKELGELYLYLQNYILNGKLNNISSVTSKIASNKSLSSYLSDNISPKKWVDKWRATAFGLMNITQVLEAITGSQKSASKLYEASGVYDFAESKTTALNRYNDFIDDFKTNFLKSKTKELSSIRNRAERMIYGFLAQVPSDQYQEALKFIDESISYHENGSAGRGSSEYGDAARKVFNEKYKESKSIAQVKLSKNDKKIVSWFRNSFASIKPEYFENAEIVHNRTLEEKVDAGLYLPFVFRSKAKTKRGQEEQDSIDNPTTFLDKEILPNRTGSTNKRKNIFNPDTRYMPLDFEMEMMFHLEKQLMDIETSFPIKKIAAFFKNPKSLDAFGSIELDKAFKERIKEYVNNSYASVNMGGNEGALFGVLNYLGNLSGRVALGSLDQSIKQSIPVLMNTMVITGKPHSLVSTMVDFAMNPEYRKVFKNSPVNRRSFHDQDMKRIYSKVPEGKKKAIRAKFIKAFKLTDELADKLMMSAIQLSDKMAAQVSWMEYYKDFLKDDFRGWDVESKDVNKSASAYADLLINNTQNVNDVDMQANYLKMRQSDDMGRLISLARRNALPFISFKANQVMDEIVQMSKMTSKKSIGEGVNRLSGRLAEQIAFTGIRNAIYTMYGAAASGILGFIYGIDIEDEEDDKRELKDDVIITAAQGIVEVMPFYGISDRVDGAIASGINRLYFNMMPEKQRIKYTKYTDRQLAKMSNDEKRSEILDKAFERYKKDGDPPMFDFNQLERPSGLEIGIMNHRNGVRDLYNAINAEKEGKKFNYNYVTSKGYELEKELTPEELKAVTHAAFIENTDILLPKDIATIAKRMRMKVLFGEKKRKASKGGNKSFEQAMKDMNMDF